MGLLGANGAGKSTTMNMIAGYFAPTSGRILWNGTDVRKLGPAYQNEVGYLPEVPPLHPELTVRESMEYVCGLRGIRPGKRKAHIEQLCELAGVADRMSMTTRSLSKGYKQRAGLAQALIGNPELIILDEPTAGLDPAGAASILANIETYRQANHATVILVSHSMEDVARLADRLVVVSQGTLPYVGTPREVFSHGEALESMGLAVPAMNRGFSRVRAMGVDIDPAVYTVEQAKAAILDALRKKGGR